MLQYACKGYHLSSAVVYAVTYYLVVWVVGRCNIVKRVVALGLPHLKILVVVSVIYLKIAAPMLCVQCLKSGLCLP